MTMGQPPDPLTLVANPLAPPDATREQHVCHERRPHHHHEKRDVQRRFRPPCVDLGMCRVRRVITNGYLLPHAVGWWRGSYTAVELVTLPIQFIFHDRR